MSEKINSEQNFLEQFLSVYTQPWVIIWIVWLLSVVILLALWYKFFRNSSFMLFFEVLFEKVYDFFEDISWKEEKRWVKVYIVSLFFIILLANLFWTVFDLISPVFGFDEKGAFNFEHVAKTVTLDINFNIAMAIIWLLVILYEQFSHLWVKHALYEYFPILGKNLIPYEYWKKPKIIDIPLFIFVKIFDIIISLFLWILDIIWHLAKIISFSFRLFWNMTSGWLLLAMLVGWLFALTKSTIWIEFPVIAPIIIYVQWLLVATIQALVFPLLTAIFIKVAKI